VPVIIVRPFNSFGPRSDHEGDAGEVIPKFVLRALAGQQLTIFGDGEQTRDFCYLSDTARGIVLAATADEALGETINLGSGSVLSIRDLAQAVFAAVADDSASLRFDAVRPGDLHRLCAATDKARRLLGFSPTVSFSEGPYCPMKSGQFHGWRLVLYGKGVAGSTVGIVGTGAVGQARLDRPKAIYPAHR
jgi:UDP-glucose 4-epimerase